MAYGTRRFNAAFTNHNGSPIIPIPCQINPIPHIEAHFFKNKMLEFTLLGYCLRRSSFKLRVVRVALSTTKRHRQLCMRAAHADTADDAA